MSNFEFNISSANSDTRIINPRGSPADVSNLKIQLPQNLVLILVLFWIVNLIYQLQMLLV